MCAITFKGTKELGWDCCYLYDSTPFLNTEMTSITEQFIPANRRVQEDCQISIAEL